MTNPVPYTPAYDFSNFQALNPQQPLPATPLDVELANLAVSFQSLIDALDDIRRSDGRLQNGSVTFDGLDPDLKQLLQTADPRVTVADLSPSAFAAQIEAEAGAAADKIMSPLGAAQAITAQRPYANLAQAQAGTDNVAVMTALRTAQAIAALRAYASQAEAEAGTENTKVMTALRVAQAVAALRRSTTRTVNTAFPLIGAGTGVTISSSGWTDALPTDRLVMAWPSAGIPAGIIPSAWITSGNSLNISYYNTTGSAITPYSGATVTIVATALRF